MMRDDPCFSCTLPDCDDRHPRCGLRLLANAFYKKRRDGVLHLATDPERQAYACFYNTWELERKAEASEGGRPYRDVPCRVGASQ